jgi:hypothetical protein
MQNLIIRHHVSQEWQINYVAGFGWEKQRVRFVSDWYLSFLHDVMEQVVKSVVLNETNYSEDDREFCVHDVIKLASLVPKFRLLNDEERSLCVLSHHLNIPRCCIILYCDVCFWSSLCAGLLSVLLPFHVLIGGAA